jgi:hypothetical protein
MELKEFVKEVLVQLCEGVSDAQKEVEKMGAVVNPREIAYSSKSDAKIDNKSYPIETVFFEVGLMDTKIKGKNTGIGVYLSNIGIGFNKTKKISSESVTRISFSVPIVLPSVSGNNRFIKGTPDR